MRVCLVSTPGGSEANPGWDMLISGSEATEKIAGENREDLNNKKGQVWDFRTRWVSYCANPNRQKVPKNGSIFPSQSDRRVPKGREVRRLGFGCKSPIFCHLFLRLSILPLGDG